MFSENEAYTAQPGQPGVNPQQIQMVPQPPGNYIDPAPSPVRNEWDYANII